MFGELAQLATSRRRLSAMPFSTTLSTTLSTEKQGLLAINREGFYQILKGLYDQGGGGKCISLGSGPRGRRFKSYRPDFQNQSFTGIARCPFCFCGHICGHIGIGRVSCSSRKFSNKTTNIKGSAILRNFINIAPIVSIAVVSGSNL